MILTKKDIVSNILISLCMFGIACMGYVIHKVDDRVSHIVDYVKEPIIEKVIKPSRPITPEGVYSVKPETKDHTTQIEQIHKESGMSFSKVVEHISYYEGERAYPYIDTSDKVTIGIGRSLQTNGISIDELLAIVSDPDYSIIVKECSIVDHRIYIHSVDVAKKIFRDPLRKEDISLLLSADLKEVKHEASVLFMDVWGQINNARQEAIVNLLFNLGLPHFKTFHEFIDAVNKLDWKRAAAEVLLSEAARKHILRYHDISVVIHSGKSDAFDKH